LSNRAFASDRRDKRERPQRHRLRRDIRFRGGHDSTSKASAPDSQHFVALFSSAVFGSKMRDAAVMDDRAAEEAMSRAGKAEIGKHAVAHEFGDETVVTRDSRPSRRPERRG
jgi:hypothetical protein